MMIQLKFIVLPVLILLLNISLLQAQGANDLSQEEALRAVLAAKKMAEQQSAKVNIAIVDAGANLKAFVRMDGSYLGSIDIAIKKAKTSRYFDIETGALGKLTQPGGMLYNIELSNGGMISFPGGVPIKDEHGNIVGAIGISGGTIEQDYEIAMAGAEAILN